MRARRFATVLVVTLALGATACSDDEPSTANSEDTILSIVTAVPPGTCDPSDTLPTPTITISGITTPATLGVGDFGCSGMNGNGYVSYNYNPVLIDGDGTITVTVGPDVVALINWAGETKFRETGDGVWTTQLTQDGCFRIVIGIANVASTSKGSFGADIRVGGARQLCPQRLVDPSDPSDGSPDATSPPPETTDAPPPTSPPATTTTSKPKPTTTTSSSTTTTS